MMLLPVASLVRPEMFLTSPLRVVLPSLSLAVLRMLSRSLQLRALTAWPVPVRMSPREKAEAAGASPTKAIDEAAMVAMVLRAEIFMCGRLPGGVSSYVNKPMLLM